MCQAFLIIKPLPRVPEEQPSSATWKDEKKSFLMLPKEKGKTKKQENGRNRVRPLLLGRQRTQIRGALCVRSAGSLAVCCVSYIFKIHAGFHFLPKLSECTCRTFAVLTVKLVATTFIWRLCSITGCLWTLHFQVTGRIISECNVVIKNYEQQYQQQ